jgi:hypothetical protein
MTRITRGLVFRLQGGYYRHGVEERFGRGKAHNTARLFVETTLPRLHGMLLPSAERELQAFLAIGVEHNEFSAMDARVAVKNFVVAVSSAQ